jgi:hypothetical protein
MRSLRRAAALLVPAIAFAACNAILGNESAIFDPSVANDATPNADGLVDPDGSLADGRVDADPDATTPCLDTTSDPKHCGTCGHDCFGGACNKGQCQPNVVVTEQGKITALAVDDTHVYWSNSTTGDVKRMPLGGGTTQTIFDAPNGTDLGDGLVRQGTDVYFTVNEAVGGVYRCPITGCVGGLAGPDQIYGPLDHPRHLAVESTGRVTFAENDTDGGVIRCTPPCNFSTDFVSTNEGFPRFVATSGTEVFWSTLLPIQGTLRKRSPPAPPTTIVTGRPVRQIVLLPNDALVFADLADGPVFVQRDGGALRALLLDDSFTNNDHVAVDDALVYFNDTVKNRILRCPLVGCDGGAEVVATVQTPPYAIVTDAKSIYWTNLGADTSNVMRLAK